ncbi:hypothetical protein K4K53_010337 [Colletotrichum sp. SAR 10_77]|nr:hypothetical protein K4K53_010337 [Colletotrichum sp. SAR 10_77]
MPRLAPRFASIVSSPAISSRSAFISASSPFIPLTAPSILPMNPPDDELLAAAAAASRAFRSSACSRCLFVISISFVASSPASFRVMSVSVTGLLRRSFTAPSVCHGLDTAANPLSIAISEIPITPIRSRHALNTPPPGVFSSPTILPRLQNANSHPANTAPCTPHATLGTRPLPSLWKLHPAPATTLWISRNGITPTSSTSSVGTVTRNPTSRARVPTTSETSHRISSPSTVARPTVTQNTPAATLRRALFCPCSACACRSVAGAWAGR